MKQAIISQMPQAKQLLKGVMVRLISGKLSKGQSQQVLVEIEPNGTIPLHTHDCDATMSIISGSASILSEDHDSNGKKVGAGHIVFFEKSKAHGFNAGSDGLIFLSQNGGIVDDTGWDFSLAN